jgi:hypothetical protein
MIITKLLKVTLIATLYEQMVMSLTRNYIKRLARTLYRQSVTSGNSQIQELSHYDQIVPYPCLQANPLGTAILSNKEKLAEIGQCHYLDPCMIIEPPPRTSIKRTEHLFTGKHNSESIWNVQPVGGHIDQLPTLDECGVKWKRSRTVTPYNIRPPPPPQ